MKTRRRKRKPEQPPKGEPSGSVAKFLNHNRGSRPPPGTRRTSTLSPVEAALEDAKIRAATGNWEDARGQAFVGLYALCHRLTYGVDATDLEDKGTMRAATRAATRALHNEFGDDRSAMVEFIKWAWDREKRKREWAARSNIDLPRLDARRQFSTRSIADYRVESRSRAR